MDVPFFSQSEGPAQSVPVSYKLPAPFQQIEDPASGGGGPITITYDYDTLYRLKEANYSTGDYYHYGYDAVGNRLNQDTQVGGLPITTTYLYDDANRVQSVNGVTYTFDANGNLLNDGINTYTYDSANRLKTLTSGSVTASYGYNGTNDRLQETVNGNTTTFTMDLNTGLTQALSDGTNNYIYGVDRIAQVNAATEYFLGDALGSVRQLTDTQGEITLAKSYAPYGEVINSAGSGASPFAFTGEQMDASGLTYLRSRYYSSGMGRFLTRDTWSGNANSPMSFNRWNYVQSDPVNYTDPSGYERASCDFNPASSKNITYIENNVHLAKSDWLNTYAAAAIAVQCYRDTWAWDVGKVFRPDYDMDYAGFGPAQITNKWKSTPYGDWIENPAFPGNTSESRGYGLRCYLPIAFLRFPKEVQLELSKSCAFCFLKKQIDGMSNFDQYFAPEPIYDQNGIDGATLYIKRMILLAVNACRARKEGCTSTDMYIVAALAQNGPGLTYPDVGTIRTLRPASDRELYKIQIDWFNRFTTDLSTDPDGTNTKEQLNRFTSAVKELINRGWSVPQNLPDFSWDTIDALRNWTVKKQVNP